MLENAEREGLETLNLGQQAMVELQAQRETLLHTFYLLKDLGLDVLKSDSLSKDINRRKLVNIVLLYLIIMMLAVTNAGVLYFKLFH